MKYVRNKSGQVDIVEDSDSIPAGAETILSTDPAVYEGTWETEKIGKRADISLEETGKTKVIQGGSAKTEAEYKLEGHMRGSKKATTPFWTEPHKAHPKDKVCINCGKPMPGARPNRKFCSDNCRKRYTERKRREEAKVVKKFRAHRGKEGQIYYIYDGKIDFVPALWCDSQKRCVKYVEDNLPKERQDEVIKQIKEVCKK